MSCSLCTYFLFLAWSCSAGHKSRFNNGLPLSFPSKPQAEWVATVPHSSFCLQVLCMNFLDIFWRSQWPFPRNTSILARLGICSCVWALPFKNRLVSEFNLSLVPSFNGHELCVFLSGLVFTSDSQQKHGIVGIVLALAWSTQSFEPWSLVAAEEIRVIQRNQRVAKQIARRTGSEGWWLMSVQLSLKAQNTSSNHPSPFEKSQSLQSNGFDSEENEGMLKTCPLLPNMFG